MLGADAMLHEGATGSAMPDVSETSSAHIVFCGALPPPVHGMAVVNAAVFEKLRAHVAVKVDFHRPVFGQKAPALLNKAASVLLGMPGILLGRLPERRVFYSSVDDGLGGLFNIMLVLAARLRKCHVTLHHHSYRYIDQPTWIMKTLVRVAGPKARHVFLCSCMVTAFREKYPHPFDAMVCTNPVPAGPEPLAAPTPKDEPPRALTLGFMSNITFEKGIGLFLELVDACLERGLDVEAIVAGPAMSEEVSAAIDVACKRTGGRLRAIGPVYGADKARFFDQIDCFVFPTRYKSETYPIVLIEALLAGRPVISYDRGCIASFTEFDGAHVIPSGARFVDEALPIVADYAQNPVHLGATKQRARTQGLAVRRRSDDEIKALCEALA
ncbi:glycosyltransferase [Vannielia litorea]|nr:glycosyltransferase [Vannielia litorea]